MADVTRLLEAAQAGQPQAAAELLPLVYDELRKLAAARMASESAGQTLDATGLVHEAYLRLLGPAAGSPNWNSRGHFFGAAAEAMRRILVEQARGKRRIKHGGGLARIEFAEHFAVAEDRVEELLAVHDALDELARHDSQAAELVKLRFFAGLAHQEAADVLGLSRGSADRLWLLARTWLFRAMNDKK